MSKNHSQLVDGKRMPVHTVKDHGCEICNMYWARKLRVEQDQKWLDDYANWVSES